MKGYLIKDLERLSGIKAHTIRIWEKRYQLFNPDRDSANIRYYSDDDLRKMLNIAFLYNNDYKISNLAKFEPVELVNQVNRVKEFTDNKESLENSLLMAMVDFNEELFEKGLSKAIIKFGLEETFLNVLIPLLDRIGIMWQTDAISPAHEHFATNLIRQKLYVATDSQVVNKPSNEVDAILFLPEWEFHELSLLFMYYVLKKNNMRCLYLGQSVPFNLVRDLVEKIKPKYLVTSFIVSYELEEVSSFLQELNTMKFPIKTILLGNKIKQFKDSLPNDIVFIGTEQELSFFKSKL